EQRAELGAEARGAREEWRRGEPERDRNREAPRAERARAEVADHGEDRGVEKRERDAAAGRRIAHDRERHQRDVKEQLFVSAVAEETEARPWDRRVDSVRGVVARDGEVVVRVAVVEHGELEKERGEGEERQRERRERAD